MKVVVCEVWNIWFIHTCPYVTTERLVWRPFDALFTALWDSPFWSCGIGSCVRSQAPLGSLKLLSVASCLFFCGEAKGLKSPCTLRWGWVLNSVSNEDSCWVTPRSPPTSTLRITQITSVKKMSIQRRADYMTKSTDQFFWPFRTMNVFGFVDQTKPATWICGTEFTLN